jgi:quercetin dioxygenase-like cupin family protein
MGANASQWRWPDDLDALTAAPDHHQLLLENELVRVIQTLVPAGKTTAVHTHRWPSAQYVVSATSFVRRDGDGNVVFDSRSPEGELREAEVRWSEPLGPHSVENVGHVELRVIMVEVKD